MEFEGINRKTARKFIQKWSIAIKVMPFVLFVFTLKALSHTYGFEMMDLNALFTSLVAGTIFLIGFLISGVLSDYKESEKIPSELAASLRTLYDDSMYLYKLKNLQSAQDFMKYQKEFAISLMDWFYKKERTKNIMDKISAMNNYLVEMEHQGVQANFIIKMKNEQSNLRKMIMRIDTIRDTEFVGSAYAIVEAMGILVAIGLILIKIEPFYASLFLVTLVTFLISYMFWLIKDLDNPFDYTVKGEGGTEVSLKPLHDLEFMYAESEK